MKNPRLYNLYYLNNTSAVYGTTVTRLLPWTGLSLPGTRKGGVERDGVRSGLWPREELLGLRVGAVVVTRVLSVSWFDHEITRAGGRPRELPVFPGEFVLRNAYV